MVSACVAFEGYINNIYFDDPVKHLLIDNIGFDDPVKQTVIDEYMFSFHVLQYRSDKKILLMNTYFKVKKYTYCGKTQRQDISGSEAGKKWVRGRKEVGQRQERSGSEAGKKWVRGSQEVGQRQERSGP